MTLEYLIQYLTHIDTYLFSFVSDYGSWAYLALFLIVFCETGLVITPFLPGDSLLFAAGSLAANTESALNVKLLFVLLVIASIVGNKLNYLIGRMLGPRVFLFPKSWLFNKKYLDDAHRFYQKHGGKTIIIARFLPIIRTFAPFVAGMGYMNLSQFALYNIASAFLWVGSLLGAGYFFGSLPFIQDNFSLVIYGLIGASLFPAVLAFCYKRFKS